MDTICPYRFIRFPPSYRYLHHFRHVRVYSDFCIVMDSYRDWSFNVSMCLLNCHGFTYRPFLFSRSMFLFRRRLSTTIASVFQLSVPACNAPSPPFPSFFFRPLLAFRSHPSPPCAPVVPLSHSLCPLGGLVGLSSSPSLPVWQSSTWSATAVIDAPLFATGVLSPGSRLCTLVRRRSVLPPAA